MQFGLRQVKGQHVGHFHAGCDESVRGALPARALAHGIDVLDARLQRVIHRDAAKFRTLDARVARKFVAGLDANGEADGAARRLLPVVKQNAGDVVLAVDLDLLQALAEHDVEAEIAHLPHDHVTPLAVKLATEHPFTLFNEAHLLIYLEVHHGLGSLQPQQAAADDEARGVLLVLGELDEADEVVDGAVYKDAGGRGAGDPAREDGFGAGGEDEGVVGDDLARLAVDGLGGGVDVDDFGVDVACEAALGRSVVLGTS